MLLTSALSCQGLVNKDLSQKISIINSLKWSTSTRFYAFSTWGSGIVQSACTFKGRTKAHAGSCSTQPPTETHMRNKLTDSN